MQLSNFNFNSLQLFEFKGSLINWGGDDDCGVSLQTDVKILSVTLCAILLPTPNPNPDMIESLNEFPFVWDSILLAGGGGKVGRYLDNVDFSLLFLLII